MTLGPSLGGASCPPQVANLSTPNQFALLAPPPEYSPLAHIDMDLKPAEGTDWVLARAMIDCGGQGSFINNKFSHRYRVPQFPKNHPISLVLADGSQSQVGHITHYNPLVLRTAGHKELIGLDVAPTAHDIILGMPWLKKHDPTVRFGRQTLTFDSPFCQQNCAHYGHTIPLHAAPHATTAETTLG